jgi:hypothetical protein
MRTSTLLAVLAVVVALGVGFAAGWLAHGGADNALTLACRDTRPQKLSLEQVGRLEVENIKAPLTMRCTERR